MKNDNFEQYLKHCKILKYKNILSYKLKKFIFKQKGRNKRCCVCNKKTKISVDYALNDKTNIHSMHCINVLLSLNNFKILHLLT